MAVPLTYLLAAGLRWPRLRGLLWLIEAMGLANRSEGLGWPGPVDKSEDLDGLGWPMQGPSIKVRNLGAGLAQAPSIKVRGWGGQAGPGSANTGKGFWGYGPRASRLTLFGKPSCSLLILATS